MENLKKYIIVGKNPAGEEIVIHTMSDALKTLRMVNKLNKIAGFKMVYMDLVTRK